MTLEWLVTTKQTISKRLMYDVLVANLEFFPTPAQSIVNQLTV